MKKNLISQKQIFFINPCFSHRVSARLTRKFFFFKKYFLNAVYINYFFFTVKKYYFYYFNLFQFFFYLNWIKYFSLKYYTVYFEDLNTFNLTFQPLLKKFDHHLGDLQKYFFINKKILNYLPFFFWIHSTTHYINQYFFILWFYNYIKNFYKLFNLLILFICLNNKINL